MCLRTFIGIVATTGSSTYMYIHTYECMDYEFIYMRLVATVVALDK